MSTDTPILVVIAVLVGISLAAFMWCLSPIIIGRFRADVRYLEHTIWQFTPEPYDGRKHVLIFYAAWIAAVIAMAIFLPWPATLLFSGILLWAPRQVLAMRWEKRRKMIDLQLGPAVLQMANNVASGMTLSQAIERVAERVDEPIKTEFAVMANYWRHGAELSSAIDEAKRRLQLPNFNLFASAVLVNQKMGGNVVDTLERLGQSLGSIQKMKEEIYAATSEGRANIKVLSIAPIIMMGMVAVMDYEAVVMLFTRPMGWAVLAVAAGLTAAGTLWAWRIMNAAV
jgi:tight adherence protein B